MKASPTTSWPGPPRTAWPPSQYPDPYLKGALDDFRVYGRTLTAAEVTTLAQ